MSTTFRLPDVGEGLIEADIVSWIVKPGDEIAVNDILVEIETAKSVVELPSPIAGIVETLLVEEGETVEVGRPIIEFSVAETNSIEDLSPLPGETPKAESETATLVGYGIQERPARRSSRLETADPSARSGAHHTMMETRGSGETINLALAKPPVRKLAKDLGIDLHDITPSGHAGNVTREDLMAYSRAMEGSTVSLSASEPLADEQEEATIIPVRGVRKATAKAMVASAFSAPHVTEFLDVDVTSTMELVHRWRETRESRGGFKITPLTVLSRAICWAVARTPEMNSQWNENEIIVHRHVNLGIAAATDRGLLVPNIKNAHLLSLSELAEKIHLLTTTAREGNASLNDQTDGTITITNVGVFGIDSGTPIINPGEAAIVAFGQIRRRPWVLEDELAIRPVTTLAVSADHRVVDGAAISAFLADLGRALEDPSEMLL